MNQSDDLPMVAILLVGIIVTAVYIAPSIIAASRKHHNLAGVIVVNLAFGWTFLGYIVALVWALANNNKQSNTHIVVNNQQPTIIPQQPQQPQQQLAPPSNHHQGIGGPAMRTIEVSASQPASNLKEQLSELKHLHDEGLITEDEYQEKRSKILA